MESHRTPVAGTERDFQSLIMRRQWNGKWRVDGFRYEHADQHIVSFGEAIPDTYSVQTGEDKFESYYGHLKGHYDDNLTKEEALGYLQRYDVMSGPAEFIAANKLQPHDRHYTVRLEAQKAKAEAKAKPKSKSQPKR